MKSKILIALITFVSILGSVVFAQFGVDVSVSPKSIGVAPCGIATYDITIKNNAADDTFAILVDGIPVNWYTLSDNVIQLKKGESKIVYLFITVDCLSPEKTFEGTITAKGQTQDKDTFTLSVVPDHIIEVNLSTDVSFCLCETGTIVAIVSNKGLFDENIDLSLSGTATPFTSLTTNNFVLKPDESKTLNLAVANTCAAEAGVYSLELTAKSRNSYAKDSASSVVRRIKCHDFTVSFEKEIRTCTVEEKEFSITVKNTGTKADIFEVKIPSFNFTERSTLLPNKAAIFNSTFLTTQAGSYNIPFGVKSSVTTKENSITFFAQKCYDVDLQVESSEITIVAGTGKLLKVKVVNKGLATDNYQIESDVSWVSIKPENLTLAGNESGDIFVYYSPEFGTLGTIETTLTAKSERSQDQEKIKINVVGEATTTLPPQTTTTQPLPTITLPPNITVPTTEIPTGEVGKPLLEKITENRFLLSIIVGILIAVIVFAVLYFVVMKGG